MIQWKITRDQITGRKNIFINYLPTLNYVKRFCLHATDPTLRRALWPYE